MSIKCRFNVIRNDFALDVDFSIPSKGVTAIFGDSGSGKTTLLRLIAGLENKKGLLKVNNNIWQDKKTFTPTHNRSVGYVFQESSLFMHLSVKDNIKYGFKRSNKGNKSIIKNAIELLQLENLLDYMPDTLSGGERQRVAIARAIAANPKMLLMDEPLASLGNKHKQEILPFLSILKTALNIPIIYVSHCIDEIIQLADWLVLLEKGKIIANNEIAKILTKTDLLYENNNDMNAIIEATVISHNNDYKLTKLNFSGGEFIVSKVDINIGCKARLKIDAHDVSLTLKKQDSTSILNILPATIQNISYTDNSNVIVLLKLGEDLLLSNITKKSVDMLDIKIGTNLYAQIKSVALITYMHQH